MYIIYVSIFIIIHLNMDIKIKSDNEYCIRTEGVYSKQPQLQPAGYDVASLWASLSPRDTSTTPPLLGMYV